MTTTIEIDEDITARLDALSARTGKDKATLLHMLIENGIEDMEDAVVADEVWERVSRGKERTFTDAEMRAELGLED